MLGFNHGGPAEKFSNRVPSGVSKSSWRHLVPECFVFRPDTDVLSKTYVKVLRIGT